MNTNDINNCNATLSGSFGQTRASTKGKASIHFEKPQKSSSDTDNILADRFSAWASSPVDYARLCIISQSIADKFPHVRLTYIGNSLLGRQIPMLSLGEGEKSVFYIGGHHASEWICSAILLRFIYEAAEYEQCCGYAYGSSLGFLCRQRTLHVLPLLNVDGAELQIHGEDTLNPLRERLIKANGSEDFSHWQANARGVDLNHNYNAGFAEYKKLESASGIFSSAPTRYSGEYPESEPECAAVCNYLRFIRPSLILSLHTQGEVIYAPNADKVKNGMAIADRLSGMCGYRTEKAEGHASYGGLCDWYTEEMHLPSYTLECGLGTNPLPLTSAPAIYRKIRQALFVSPMLV